MLPLGNLVITREVHNAIKENHLSIDELREILERNRGFDWGEGLTDMDRAANDYALKIHARIISSYFIRGLIIWVITEYSGHTTVLML